MFLGSRFLNVLSLTNIARQISIDVPIALGQAVVLISGGIDISVGSVMAMAAVISVAVPGLNVPLAIILALSFGAFVGLINGLLVTKAKIVPFIATLGTMSAVRGLVLVTTGQRAIMSSHPNFAFLGGGSIWLIPFPFIVSLLLLIAITTFLQKTRSGRNFFAIGGDLDNAYLAGIPIFRTRVLPFVISGTLASLAGVLLASRLESANPQIGMDTALASIAAAIIGGASMLGGRGSAFGAFLGVAILGILSTGMNLLGVTTYYQIGIKSAVFISVVVVDAAMIKYGKKRRR